MHSVISQIRVIHLLCVSVRARAALLITALIHFPQSYSLHSLLILAVLSAALLKCCASSWLSDEQWIPLALKTRRRVYVTRGSCKRACTSNTSFANSTTRPTFADTHSHTGSCYSRRPISHRQIIHYWWASESSSCPFFVHIAGEKITSPTLITDEELAPVCCSFIFFVTVNRPEILKMHWKKKRRTWSSMTRWFVYSINKSSTQGSVVYAGESI